MSTTDDLSQALKVLRKHFDFHTAILYGSRATGSYLPESDYDFLLIKQDGPRERRVFTDGGFALDVIVDPEVSTTDLRNYIYLYDCKVIEESEGFGKKLVGNLKEFLAAPLPAMPPNRIEQRRKQSLDSLRYIGSGTVLGAYRRHWLLSNLLPAYFELRQKWFLGDKFALDWIAQNDPTSFIRFERGLAPQASVEDIRELIEGVFQGYGPR